MGETMESLGCLRYSQTLQSMCLPLMLSSWVWQLLFQLCVIRDYSPFLASVRTVSFYFCPLVLILVDFKDNSGKKHLIMMPAHAAGGRKGFCCLRESYLVKQQRKALPHAGMNETDRGVLALLDTLPSSGSLQFLLLNLMKTWPWRNGADQIALSILFPGNGDIQRN